MTDDDRPTLGGLFSGIGGFELAWQRNGGRVAWVCEIEPAAQRVLAERFPGVKIYTDVADLDPAEVEPVDVLTGGSPCQGFSVAGRRTGLEHGESRLFADYVRVLDGLAERGLRWAVWENVPGVLSIENDDGERTFEHVVAALVRAREPVRLARRARWNAGMAARGQRAVSWRILDSRHFGVPQRRRRVYACVALGDPAEDRAFRALLALPEGSDGDPDACGQTRPRARAAAAPSPRADGIPTLAGTLTGGGDRGWRADPQEVAQGLVVPDQASTITASMGNGFTGNTQDANVVAVRGDESHALTAEGHDASEDGTGRGTPVVALTYAVEPETGQGANLRARRVDESPAVTATSEARSTDRGVRVVEPMAVRMGWGNSRESIRTDDHVGTLATDGAAHVAEQTSEDNPAWGVRRLTPVECERLQAFPDGWTEPAGSDSGRYRALGNAVTVSVPQWLFARMLDADRDR